MARTLSAIGIIMAILLIGCEPLAMKSTIMELSDPPTWNLSQALLMQGGAGDQFGISVDISDSYMIIGAPLHDSATDGGAAYIYVRIKDGSWQLQEQLVSYSPAAGINFGSSVAITDLYAVVGSSGGSTHKIDIFERSGTTWTNDVISFSPAGAINFGTAVDVNGDYVIAGDSGVGNATIYFRDTGIWAPQSAPAGTGAEYFGYSVSIDGDYAVIGAPAYGGSTAFGGAAYISERSGTAWPVEVIPLEPTVPGTLEYYGASISISGTDMIIGAPESSTVYFYSLAGSTWEYHSSASIPGMVGTDQFGWSVSISDRVAVVGAPGTSGGLNTGSVHIFEKYESTWLYKTPGLVYSKGSEDDYFGHAVSVSGSHLIIGAYSDTNSLGSDAGTGFVYKRE